MSFKVMRMPIETFNPSLLLGDKKVEVLMTDLPWGDGTLKMFATKYNKKLRIIKGKYKPITYTELLQHLLNILATRVTKYVFIMTSKKCSRETMEMVETVATETKEYEVSYRRKYPYSFIMGSLPGAYSLGYCTDYTGVDTVCKLMDLCLRDIHHPGWSVLDPCCGQCDTGYYALKYGMDFYGSDFDETRIEKGKERLKRYVNE